ncbi:MAG TPA: hypothetical protein DCL48_07715, partial [Alphaproteobacteria bacterium]|nr:hypothetical protein [Alphaproteobacteria bacterium]
MTPAPLSAAVLIIGDEILSGRTQDTNLAFIARYLASFGIPIRAARVVPDVPAEIVGAVNELRAQHTYLFTTGGIGPTHDDITVDAIAKALGVPVVRLRRYVYALASLATAVAVTSGGAIGFVG